MPQPTGTPTWIDLGSNHADESRTFYRELFGWSFEDQGEEFGHYEMVSKDGNVIAGFMNVAGMPGPDGNPLQDRWDIFLAVDDIAARVELAKKHGATVISEPMAMPGTGSFALVTDPTGAVIGMWESLGFDGYTFTGTPGTPVWFELMTKDFDTALEFYREVFEFDIVYMGSEDGSDGVRYVTNGAGEKACAGICDASPFMPAEVTPFWRFYVEIEATEPALARVRELGGQILDGPMDSPFGRCTTVADPGGATFQLNAGSEAQPE